MWHSFLPGLAARRLGGVVLTSLLLIACPTDRPAPRAGLSDAESRAAVSVPGAVVHAWGGNLMVARDDLVIDTRIGPHRVGATYNASDGAWTWSFEIRLGTDAFTDATGQRYPLARVGLGDAIPGSVWVRHAADAVRTRGGLVHVFGSDGGLVAIHWNGDPYPRLVHRRATDADGSRRIAAIDQCQGVDDCEPVFEIDRDAAGRVVRVSDRAGREARFDYDALGRLARARDPVAVATGLAGAGYAWDADRLVELTTPDGERIRYRYDQARRLVEASRVGLGDDHTRFRYAQTSGHRSTTLVTDALGAERRLTFDPEGRLLEDSRAGIGGSWRFEWSGARVVRRIDPNGAVTGFEWSDDEPVRITTAAGNTIEIVYARHAQNRAAPLARAVRSVSDALGPISSAEFDPRGRPIALADGAGEVTRLAWDSLGRLRRVTPAVGPSLRLDDYGPDGHPRTLRSLARDADDGEDGDGRLIDERRYDAVGNLVRGIDPADPLASQTPGVLEREFDANRRIVAGRVTATAGVGGPVQREIDEVRIERRADGRPLRILRPAGADSEFVYDAAGRLVERRDWRGGDWQSVRFEADLVGRRVGRIEANGMERWWAYDAAGRPVRSAAGRDGLATTEVTNTWEGTRLVARRDSVRGAEERFEYDAAGRLRAIRFPEGERIEVDLDLRDRPVGHVLVEADGTELRTLGWRYQADGAPAELLDGDTLRLAWESRAGRLAHIRYGNGLVRDFGYDDETGLPASAVLSVESAPEGSELREQSEFGLPLPSAPDPLFLSFRTRTPRPGDPQGPWIESNESFLLRSGCAEAERCGHRLVSFGTDPLTLQADTHYDPLGNVLTDEVPAPDTGGLLIESVRFEYDAARTRLERIVRTGSGADREAGDDDVVRDYEYDASGYVVAIDGVPIAWTPLGRVARIGDEVAFEWDASGRPISRRIGDERTHYAFGGSVETRADGSPEALDLGEVRIDLRQGRHRYRHLDPRGNVKLVTDHEGHVAAVYRYTGYARWHAWGTDEPDGLGFAQGSQAGDFWVIGARVYDPLAHRFLSPDPEYQWLNQYAYTGGNPIWFWDPTGAKPKPVPRWFARFVRVTAWVAGFASLVSALVPGGQVAALAFGVVGFYFGTLSLLIDEFGSVESPQRKQLELSPCACPAAEAAPASSESPVVTDGPGATRFRVVEGQAFDEHGRSLGRVGGADSFSDSGTPSGPSGAVGGCASDGGPAGGVGGGCAGGSGLTALALLAARRRVGRRRGVGSQPRAPRARTGLPLPIHEPNASRSVARGGLR